MSGTLRKESQCSLPPQRELQEFSKSRTGKPHRHMTFLSCFFQQAHSHFYHIHNRTCVLKWEMKTCLPCRTHTHTHTRNHTHAHPYSNIQLKPSWYVQKPGKPMDKKQKRQRRHHGCVFGGHLRGHVVPSSWPSVGQEQGFPQTVIGTPLH